MKLLVDAQLPPRLARDLANAGHDVRHTLDLPIGNATTDEEICRIADSENRIVVTKDSDFVASFLLKRSPAKLLLISTGNLDNDRLLTLIGSNAPQLEAAFATYTFVELSLTTLTVHC